MSCGCGESYNAVGAGKKKTQIVRWAEGKLSKAELIQHAKKHKIPNYSKLNKADLEAAIKKARNK